MDQEFGRNSIAARKAKRRQENLAAGKPECYLDEGVARRELEKPDGRCAGCREREECSIHMITAPVARVELQPHCFGDAAMLDLDNPSEECKQCPVRDECGEIVSEIKPIGPGSATEDAIVQSPEDDAMPSADVHANHHESLPYVDGKPDNPEGETRVGDSAVEPHRGNGDASHSQPPVQTSLKSQSRYSFPVSQDDIDPVLKGKTMNELKSHLEHLFYSRGDHPGRPKPYPDIRAAVCQTWLEMNLRGGCSPSSRPMRRVPPPTRLTDEDKLLSNDRQVGDLHYAWHNRLITTGIHCERFQAEQFDFHYVDDFVSRRGTAEQKAIALALTEAHQLLLTTIQTRAVAERRRTIHAGANLVRKTLADIASRPSSRLSPVDVERLMNIHLALRIARGSPALASEVLLAMTGETVTPTAMSAKKKWLAGHGLPTE